MMRLSDVAIQLKCEPTLLIQWIEQDWVRPAPADSDWLFEECDVARVQLILELREMAVSDDALPLVLSLLDQLYAARATLRRVHDLFEHLPPPLRAQLKALLDGQEPG